MSATAVSTSIPNPQMMPLEIKSVEVKKYIVQPEESQEEEGFTSDQINFFHLSKKTQENVLTTLNQTFDKLEKSEKPGAGYIVKIVRSTSKTLEASLEVHGSRVPNTPIETFTRPNCHECLTTSVHRDFWNFSNSTVRVLDDFSGNPLVVTKFHTNHWFDADLNAQMEMLSTTEKILNMISKNCSLNYELRIPVGIEGGQNFSHAQIHILTNLSLALDKKV